MSNVLVKKDFYKADHRRQYPDGTVKVYSNFTPRKGRVPGRTHIVFFGLQYLMLKYLIKEWNETFFNLPKELVVARYKRRLDNALGKDSVPTDHIAALHDLGYLPIHIKALKEGTRVPYGVPVFTIINTRAEQYWLVNMLETALSNMMWKPCTSATTAFMYRKVFEQFWKETVGDNTDSSFVMWQGHDFSARGMSYWEDAEMSGAGHLLSFFGTDTIAAIDTLEDYYFADSDKEIVGGSVPATEHSVMCMGTQAGELETVRRLITELYPSGPISIVWDTWDYWGGFQTLEILKDVILSRTGHPFGLDKVIIRPDSGDPYRIIVGYFENEIHRTEDGEIYLIELGKPKKILTEQEVAGSIQLLWDIFGGSTTERGFRQLNSKIGLIYGDSITLDRQKAILEGLKRKNFASSNVVLGIGSFTYEYVTRDTDGWAMKATYGEVLEEVADVEDPTYLTVAPVGREIFKNPKTDDGTKKSAKGLLAVHHHEETGELYLKDQCSWEEELEGELETVFFEGEITRTQTLAEIRSVVSSYL